MINTALHNVSSLKVGPLCFSGVFFVVVAVVVVPLDAEKAFVLALCRSSSSFPVFPLGSGRSIGE